MTEEFSPLYGAKNETEDLRSIITGSRILVQGIFVRTLANGKIAVRVGGRIYVGKEVT